MAHTMKGFAEVMNRMFADQLENQLLWVMAGSPLFNGPPTDEQRKRARELRERAEREGKVLEILAAATPPSPEEIAGQTEDLLRKIVDLSGVRACLNNETLKQVDDLLGTGYAA